MSGRTGEAGRGEGRGRAGQQRGGGRFGRGGRGNNNRQRSTHVSKTVVIKDDVFDCGRPEHAALFEKSDKAVIEFIRREGVLEPMLIAEGLEDGMLPTITTPPVPARIPDPENPPQFIPDPNNPGGPQIVDPAHPGGMMEDRAETIIWETPNRDD